MSEFVKCPATNPVFGGVLTCDYEDKYAGTHHTSFLHRNNSVGREWQITPQDRVRWGVVGPDRKKKTKVTDEVSEEAFVDEGNGETTELGETD